MDKGLLKSVCVFLMAVMISGCSTVFGRQHDEQNVTFDSNVQGVEVNCAGKRVDTPGSIPLRQSKSASCVAQAPGYEKKAFTINSGISWDGFGNSTAINTALWGWWTFGIGTVIGWLVDSVSGAMRNFKEENFYLEMKPVGTTTTSQKVLEKTVDIGKAIVNTPVNLVKDTTSTVIDTTVSGSAQQMGIVENKAGKSQSESTSRRKEKKSLTVI